MTEKFSWMNDDSGNGANAGALAEGPALPTSVAGTSSDSTLPSELQGLRRGWENTMAAVRTNGMDEEGASDSLRALTTHDDKGFHWGIDAEGNFLRGETAEPGDMIRTDPSLFASADDMGETVVRVQTETVERKSALDNIKEKAEKASSKVSAAKAKHSETKERLISSEQRTGGAKSPKFNAAAITDKLQSIKNPRKATAVAIVAIALPLIVISAVSSSEQPVGDAQDLTSEETTTVPVNTETVVTIPTTDAPATTLPVDTGSSRPSTTEAPSTASTTPSSSSVEGSKVSEADAVYLISLLTSGDRAVVAEAFPNRIPSEGDQVEIVTSWVGYSALGAEFVVDGFSYDSDSADANVAVLVQGKLVAEAQISWSADRETGELTPSRWPRLASRN